MCAQHIQRVLSENLWANLLGMLVSSEANMKFVESAPFPQLIKKILIIPNVLLMEHFRDAIDETLCVDLTLDIPPRNRKQISGGFRRERHIDSFAF